MAFLLYSMALPPQSVVKLAPTVAGTFNAALPFLIRNAIVVGHSLNRSSHETDPNAA